MAQKAYLETPAAVVDGRRQPRRTMRLEAKGVLPGGQSANVTIHNISAAGLLIQSDLSLAVGELLAIDLPNVGPIGAEIVWQSERLFGCAFQQALGEAALASAQLRAQPFSKDAGRDSMGQARWAPDDSFGIRLNRLRRERSLTLAKVAAELGVSKPTVWAWEKGKAKPIPERIAAIAKVLQVDEGELTQSTADNQSAELINECRQRIATAYRTKAESVRIMIEV